MEEYNLDSLMQNIDNEFLYRNSLNAAVQPNVVSSTIIDVISADISDFVLSGSISTQLIDNSSVDISVDIVDAISSMELPDISVGFLAVIESEYLNRLQSYTLVKVLHNVFYQFMPDYYIWYISCLNGVPTSQLTNIKRLYGSVPSTTALLLSKAEKLNEEDVADVQLLDSQTVYNDARLEYTELSLKLYDDDMPKTKMMRHDVHEFARASHTHPFYDWFKVWPDFGPNGKNKDAEVSANLMTFHFKNDNVQNDVSVCFPKIVFETESPRPRHLLGELMFVAANSFDDVEKQVGNITNPNKEDFSGWIYPMGQTIYTNRFEFMEVKQLFGNPATAMQFKVPNLAGFIEPTAYDSSYDAGQAILEKLPGYNNVPVHTHDSIVIPSDIKEQPGQIKKSTVNAPTGRAYPCDQTIDGISLNTMRSNAAIICAWDKGTVERAQKEYPPGTAPQPCHAIPAGWRWTTPEEKENLFSLTYDDAKFDESGTDILDFAIEGGEMQDYGRQYTELDEENTMSWPEHVFLPVLLFIGFPNNNNYKYFG